MMTASAASFHTPAMRTRQIQMIGRALAQVVVDLAAVDLRDLTRRRDDRDHDRAVEMLVTGFAQEPQLLQPAADLAPLTRVFSGNRNPNVRSAKPNLNVLDGIVGADAAPIQSTRAPRGSLSSVSW